MTSKKERAGQARNLLAYWPTGRRTGGRLRLGSCVQGGASRFRRGVKTPNPPGPQTALILPLIACLMLVQIHH